MSAVIESAVSELAALATERLEAELKTHAAHLAAATCRWLLMVAEYDKRRAFESWECISMEQWLSIHASLSPSAALAHVAVARRLGELPLITAAFAEGRLSYSKVRALCRVACAENEHDWLHTGLHASGAQLERITADTRRVLVAQQHGIAARQLDERKLSWQWTDDGMLRLDAVLPPEVGTLLVRMLGEERDRLSLDPSVELAARNADAFASLLERVATTDTDENGNDDGLGRRALIVVHEELDGTCRLEGGPPIPREAADELACGADHLTATHSEEGIRFDRRRRFPTAPMRRHVRKRDRCCAMPGCGQRRGLHVHHIREYNDDGETVKENLILLCPRHHGAIHRRGWTVSGDPEAGTLVFRRPDGAAVTSDLPGGDGEEIIRGNRCRGVDPAPHDAAAQSMGERYDHELAVWAYANNRPTMRYPAPNPASRRHRPDQGTTWRAPASAEARPSTPGSASAEANVASSTTASAEARSTSNARAASAEASAPPIDPTYDRTRWCIFDENDNLISVPTYSDD